MTSVTPVDLAFSVIEPPDISDEEAPVIFLHGLTSSKEYWDDIPSIVANATKRKVYIVDARNHGDSPWSDIFNFDVNAVDFLHFMDKHGIQKAILVGHSMGGVTGIKTALKEPHRVEKLITEDIGVKFNTNTMNERFSALTSLLSQVIQGMNNIPDDVNDELEARSFVQKYLGENLPPEMRVLMAAKKPDPTRLMMKRTADGHFTYKANFEVIIKALKDYKTMMSENTGMYHKPTLFIYGTESHISVPDQEEDIKKLFPKAELLPVQNATHDVHKEFPEEFTNALIEFIGRK